MIYTTLNRIWALAPPYSAWQKLLHNLGKQADDEPLSFEKIVELNGISDALWCARAEPQRAQFWRLYAVWCARRVVHLTTTPASTAALLDVAERHALGQANAQELAVARDVYRAAQAAEAPTWAAQAAAWAVYKDADTAVAWAAQAAAAAQAAEREAQTEEFIRRLRDHKEEMP